MFFSVIIPVYNRPDEVEEILASLSQQTYHAPFEIVIIEDGSTVPCIDAVGKYARMLDISYFAKPNSGPGDSRNFGMRKAKGDYFIIFDSDCIIPPRYLTEVLVNLETDFVHCFGGPDKADDSFTEIQKAIDFTMTSFMTTGGIRGGSEAITKFQPRSFNMGLSREAFEATAGFGNIHPGEDPDLSIRLWKLGYKTKLFPTAYVYHKRRISWLKFYQQVNKFGKARPILDSLYPEYAKVTFFFPTMFVVGFMAAVGFLLAGNWVFIAIYLAYFSVLFIAASVKLKNITIAFKSVVAAAIQFYGYGSGFLISFLMIQLLKRDPVKTFPELYYKK